MALFPPEDFPVLGYPPSEPDPLQSGAARHRRRPNRAAGIGILLVGVAVIAAVVVSTLPAPYVIERPGPTFDVLGDVTVSGEQVPLISIPGEKTYPTEGALRMTTVTLSGRPENLPSWVEVLGAWFDSRTAVVPVDAVFPPGSTAQQNTDRSRIEMENSQQEAIAAALGALHIAIDGKVVVEEVIEGSPAAGILQPGDIILSLDGIEFEDVSGLRAAIAAHGTSRPADIVIVRDGKQQTVQVTPVAGAAGAGPVLQILVSNEYKFPFVVDIKLQNVGGPSAGMMFALGIIDKLTASSLTGNVDIAGTGTISGDGRVGPIGGIRQKLFGAKDAGSTWFLAPEANCDEVVGHVPGGMTVVAVANLDQAVSALEAIREGKTTALRSCEAVLAG